MDRVEQKQGTSLWQESVVRLFRNRAALVGGMIILVLIAVAVFAPVIAPRHYADGDFSQNFAAPGETYLLGADFMGRDVLSRLIYGTRVSLTIGLIAALTSFVIGTIYGTVSGYFGGRLDNYMMRVVDILYAFPDLLLIILLMVVFKTGFGGEQIDNWFVRSVASFDRLFGGMFFILVGISFRAWVEMARISRGMAISLRETEFIQSARAIGAKDRRIVLRHMIPNLVSPLIVRITLDIPNFIATEAFLSFIGLGVDPPMPSWGAMIGEGMKAMRSYPHLAIYPCLALALAMLAFNFFGDGLRDALDPRMKH